jgi:hypothetical protein
MDDKHKRLLDEIQHIEDQGIGEITIKVREDGKWLITCEKWVKNPSHQTIIDAVEWGFRGVTQEDLGEVVLKQVRKIRL